MQRRLVFIPISRQELRAITGEIPMRERTGYTVTDELMAELGYEPAHTEDAEYAALVLASVGALSRFGERLVLVAEVPAAMVTTGVDAANGECRVAEVQPGWITCWFSDEDDADVAGAAAAAEGLSIDEAWEQAEVSDLIHAHQLLWNDVEEFKRAG